MIMGLDNGIIVKDVVREQLPRWIHYPFSMDYDYVDICYWRKWWGMRNKFLRAAYPNYKCDNCEFDMGTREIRIMRSILIDYLVHPSHWDNDYWEYDKYTRKGLIGQIWSLYLLEFWYKRHPDVKIIFYDSY